MQKARITFEIIVYQGANHAFFNDTGERYVASAANAAWEKTMAWLDKYLKG